MATIETNVDNTAPKLEDQLKVWSTKLNELAAKVGVVGQEAKLDARKRCEEMRTKIKVAQSKLEEAKAAGEARWSKLKAGLEASWKELEAAFQKLTH